MRTFQGKSRLLRPPSRWWLVLSAVLLAAGLAFLTAFGVEQQAYSKSAQYYAALEQTVRGTGPSADRAENPVDFAVLQGINADVAAWLEMPGLGISLPVVQAQDNQTWLDRGFDGAPSPQGCLFFGVPEGEEPDLYRVLYGHNLHTGAMFGNLPSYRQEDFYRQNPTFTLYTPDGEQVWRIFSCHDATDTEDLYRTGRTQGAEYDAFVEQLRAASLYDTGVQPPAGAQVLTLSTCATSYGSGLQRFVVHACRES